MNLRPVAYVGLLAIPSVVAYAATESLYPTLLAVLNVLLITWGLRRMFSPTESEQNAAAH